MRLLVIAAHPDDAEIGAAGLILGATRTTILTLCASDSARRIEAERGAAVLGAGLVLRRYPDGGLRPDLDLVREIEDAVTRLKPDLVAYPPADDTHQDHRAAALAVVSATRRSRVALAEYDSASVPLSWVPNTYLPIEADDLARATAALAEHQSQRSRPYCAPAWRQARARAHGYRVGVDLAEAYRLARWTLGSDGVDLALAQNGE